HEVVRLVLGSGQVPGQPVHGVEFLQHQPAKLVRRNLLHATDSRVRVGLTETGRRLFPWGMGCKVGQPLQGVPSLRFYAPPTMRMTFQPRSISTTLKYPGAGPALPSM